MNERVSAACPSPPPPGRAWGISPWRMAVLGLVILLCGMVIGAAITARVARRAIVHAATHPEEMPARAAERLAARLDLTDEQRTQVEEILRRRLASLAALRVRMRPRLDRELDALDADVSAILDERQQARWHRDFQRLRAFIQPPLPAESPSPADRPTDSPGDASQ